MALSGEKALRGLLAVIGLPDPEQLVGRRFCFSYEDEQKTCAVAGTVIGIDFYDGRLALLSDFTIDRWLGLDGGGTYGPHQPYLFDAINSSGKETYAVRLRGRAGGIRGELKLL